MTLKTILLTGASDGIGLELANLLWARGQRPFLLARRPFDQLPPEATFPQEHYLQVDLAEPTAPQQVAQLLAQRGITQLDLLIHNAGVGYYGTVREQTAHSIDTLLAVNLTTPIGLTHTLLPLLQQAKGQVMFVSSVAANLPTPEYAVYSATKAGLEGFARSLRIELEGQVTVQVVQPGATRTAMHQKIGFTPKDASSYMPAKKAAELIWQSVEEKRPFTVLGTNNQLLRVAGQSGLVDPILTRVTKNQESDTPAKTQGKVCVITGAADGIGLATAKRFAQAGYTICGIDRDSARAQQALADLTRMGASAHFIIADLATDEGLLMALRRLTTDLPPINVFVHNAGISAVGRFADVPLARQEQVIAVNLRPVLHLTARLLNRNRFTQDSTLVFISSLSHFVGYPGATVYAASKDAVSSFARSLRASLAPQQNVLTVYPGPTRTTHAARYSPDNSREANRMLPEELAQQILTAVQQRQATLLPGAGARLFASLGKVSPRLMDFAMKKTILDKIEDGQNYV